MTKEHGLRSTHGAAHPRSHLLGSHAHLVHVLLSVGLAHPSLLELLLVHAASKVLVGMLLQVDGSVPLLLHHLLLLRLHHVTTHLHVARSGSHLLLLLHSRLRHILRSCSTHIVGKVGQVGSPCSSPSIGLSLLDECSHETRVGLQDLQHLGLLLLGLR